MNTVSPANHDSFDAIVVGSGAGGSAAASRLAAAGLDVLIVEKGHRLPCDGSTLDVQRVVNDGEFKSSEIWLDRSGQAVVPEEYFNVGGKTKWYGAALLRFSAGEFLADPDHQCLAWPFGLDALLPYYREAETALGLETFPAEPGLAEILRRFARAGTQWSAAPLTMGVRAAIADHPHEARHFDGFASPLGLMADAEGTFLAPALRRSNMRIVEGCPVSELLADPAAPTLVQGVRLADGRVIRARSVLLAAGALHSPRLLQRYLHCHSLDRLPMAVNVGRNLKLHLLTAVLAFSSRPQTDLLRKTSLLVHADLPHSSVQPLGFDAELLANLIPGYVPRPAARWMGRHAYGFFLQTEDGSHPANRVMEAGVPESGGAARPVIDYNPSRVSAARDEHARLVALFRRSLLRAGCPNAGRSVGLHGTAHACGTLVSGNDPRSAVVDADGKVHGMEGIYVVDGSVLPRVSRVNPALTIYAWGLRTADRLGPRLRESARTGRELAPEHVP